MSEEQGELGNETEEKPLENDESTVKHWLTEIDLAEKDHEQFMKDGDKAEREYFNDKEKSSLEECPKRMAMYWATIETTKPSIFSSRPNPDIRRRWKDRDKIANISAEVLERCVSFSMDVHQDFNAVCERVRDDFLVVNRAITWERYAPTIEAQDNAASGERKAEKLAYAETITDYVPWRDFLHSPARIFDELRWVSRKHRFTRAELKEHFGAVGADVELTESPKDWDKSDKDGEEQKAYKKGIVYEIWDKDDRKVLFISPGYKKKALKIEKDPLGLKGFFPCPNPLQASFGRNSVIPKPEYFQFKDQLNTIDNLTDRVDAIIDSIRVVAAADPRSVDALNSLMRKDLEFVPVPGFGTWKDAGGWAGIADFLPIEPYVAALEQLLNARQNEISNYYEISGNSDIMRGVTDYRETAKAQDLKSQYASSRLREKQRRFQNFLADVIRIKAEVIAEHFTPELLLQMSGVERYSEPMTREEFDEAVKLLKNDVTRDYSIEIESDSTVLTNEAQDQQSRNQFLAAVNPLLQAAPEMAAGGPAWAKMIKSIIMFVARGYKGGRGLETELEGALDGLIQQQQAAAQQPPPQDPAIAAQMAIAQAEMAKAQNQGQKNQMDYQTETARLQGEFQLKMQELKEKTALEQAQIAIKQQELQLKAQELMLKGRDLDLKAAELGLSREKTTAELNLKAFEVGAKHTVALRQTVAAENSAAAASAVKEEKAAEL